MSMAQPESVSRWVTAIYRRMLTCQDCRITDAKSNNCYRDKKGTPLLATYQSGRYPRFVDRGPSWPTNVMSL